LTDTDIVIRPVGRDEVMVWRALRIAAMRAYPSAFSSSPDDLEEMPIEEVASRIPLPGGDDILFGVYLDGELQGCAGFMREKGAKEAHKGYLWGVYVHTALQGRGLGEQLTQAVIDWARPRVDILRCAVTSDNLAAKALYLRLGFKLYGTEPRAIRTGGRDHDDDLLALEFR
jgi:ribosomal protein S18 acetylase RimI-like enzyme